MYVFVLVIICQIVHVNKVRLKTHFQKKMCSHKVQGYKVQIINVKLVLMKYIFK